MSSPDYDYFVSLCDDSHTGLVHERVSRMFTLPWSSIGEGGRAISKILEKTNHFKKFDYTLKGIPVAYKLDKSSLGDGWVMESQPCVHIHVDAHFVIFKPKVDDCLKGRVTSMINQQATVCMHNVCTVRVDMSHKPVISGDLVVVKISDTSISEGSYALRGTLVKVSKDRGTSFADTTIDLTDESKEKLSRSVKKLLSTPIDSTSLPETCSSMNLSLGEVKRKVNFSDTDTEDDEHSLLAIAETPPIVKEEEEDSVIKKKKKKRKKKEEDDKLNVDIDCTLLDEFAIPTKKKKKKDKHRHDL